MLTRDEAMRCAHAAVALRPDWTIPQLMAVLGDTRVKPRPFPHVAIALAYIAGDEDTKSPGRLFAAGPWWDACRTRSAEPSTPVFRPLAADDCHECGGSKLGSHAGHSYTPPPTKPVDASQHVAVIRAQLTPPAAPDADTTEESA